MAKYLFLHNTRSGNKLEGSVQRFLKGEVHEVADDKVKAWLKDGIIGPVPKDEPKKEEVSHASHEEKKHHKKA